MMKKYILNIYKVLLTRAIRGTYVYVCDPALRNYFKTWIASADAVRT
ncbi:DNA/RNA helicase domain-containing protein [Holdemania filiformis]